MKCTIILTVVLTLLCGRAINAEIAILPYKIDNSSTDFPVTMGGEYSRLLSVASILSKEDCEIMPPRDIDLDLERMKLSSQDVITKDDLDLLGKSNRIDYVLSGVLARTGGIYRSDSVLYSVRDRRIIVRTRVADSDLFKLAEKEIKEALVSYRNKTTRSGSEGGRDAMDVLFLLDMSYQMSQDWDFVKNAVTGYSARLIDTLRFDTRVYIVPFSDRIIHPSSSALINSITAVRSELEKLKPAGGAGSDDLAKSLQYSIGNVRWRTAAGKVVIIISNSSVSPRAVEKYGNMARKKKIIIHAVSLGKVPGDDSEALGRLASISGGRHAHAAYHQRLFDAAGDPVDVYMENGRLFKSRLPDGEWKKGLFEATASGRQYGKPRSFIDEIFYNEKNISITPYAMPQTYARITLERIINQDPLENNIDQLVKRVSEKRNGRKTAVRAPAGKALVTDGKISLWITAHDDDFMNFFIDGQKTGFVSPVGVIVKKDAGAAYGVALIPVVKGLTADYIPRILVTSLGDIVKHSDYYCTKGLLYPPVWFVNVKIDNAEKFRSGKDIRGR